MFKSCVEGNAIVTFGGGVGVGVTRQHRIKRPHVVVDFCSKELGEIGRYYKPDMEECITPTPVKLVFEKIESIDCLIESLTEAKIKLKQEIDTYEEEE